MEDGADLVASRSAAASAAATDSQQRRGGLLLRYLAVAGGRDGVGPLQN